MFKLNVISASLVAVTLVAAPAFAQTKNFATVNGKPIPQYVADAFISEQQASAADKNNPQFKSAVREELIRRNLLSQEAIKKGYDKKPEFQGQLELAKQALLIRALAADYVKANPVSDAQLKKDYDALKAQVGSTEYHARHILVEKEEEAKQIIAKLNKGEKFADLAKQSKDEGSKVNGGDLGWNAPSSFVPAFSAAMVKLEKGKYTKEPVKSDFGYHVILLEETRPLPVPTFEEVKPQLLQRANQQKLEKMVEELRAKAKVE